MKNNLTKAICLSSVLCSFNLGYSVFAQEESTTESVENEISSEQEVIETMELTEEVKQIIKDANGIPESKNTEGFLGLAFATEDQSIPFLNLDYGIQYNLEDPLSAEIRFSSSTAGSSESFSYFAYLYKNYIFESRDEQWVVDSAASIEPVLKSFLTRNENSEVSLTDKYFNYYETENTYELVLKEEVSPEEFYADINQKFGLETIRENLKLIIDVQAEARGIDVNESQLSAIDVFFSQDKVAEVLASDPKINLSYSKESGKLENVYLNLNVNVVDVYELLGANSESSPETLSITLDNNFSQHGEVFDFSFLDDVVPQR